MSMFVLMPLLVIGLSLFFLAWFGIDRYRAHHPRHHR